MTRENRNNPLSIKLNKDVRAIGMDLNKLMKLVLEALAALDVELAGDLLPQVQEFQNKEYASRETCLEILAHTRGNNIELEWIRCAHKVLTLMGASSLEIAEIACKISEQLGFIV